MATNEPIIIKRVEEDGEGGHHGGGWKVAYADFMTAMMAFFLLLWILAASDEEKLRGLADYFTPSLSERGGRGDGILEGSVLGPDGVLSGTDGPQSEVQLPSFGQENPLSVFDSRLKEDRTQVVIEYEPAPNAAADGSGGSERTQGAGGSLPYDSTVPAAGETEVQTEGEPGQLHAELQQELQQEREERETRIEALEQEIARAIDARPDLQDLLGNIRFVRTPEGLNVQILDQEGRSMFARGSSRIDDHTRDLIEIIGRAISGMPYPVNISGHTDSVPFSRQSGYSNWELSADRANATRRILVGTGVSPARIERISGLADTVPLTPATPDAPQNRRIDILLVYPDPALVPHGPVQP